MRCRTRDGTIATNAHAMLGHVMTMMTMSGGVGEPANEAIANAAKHAPGAQVRVSGRLADGALTVDVADDGPGGARADGGGLSGLRNRLTVLSGELTVDSPEGGPTTVRLEIPER